MHRIALIILFAGTTSLFAQPDFDRSDVFQIGDRTEYLAVDATGLDPGPAGNGVTWDFSNLPRNPAEDYEVNWEPASSAPNAGQFPAANTVEVQDAGATTAYTFYEISDSRFTLHGLDLPDIGVLIYTDTVIWLDFPLSFNQVQMDDFVGTYTANVNGITGTVNRTGDLTTTYDGYGTLILPDGTSVNNVRRLKIDQVVDDVISVMGFSITTRVVTETYNFFVEGNRNPIFHITYGDTTVNPPGLNTQSVFASYQGNSGGGPQPTGKKRRGAHLTAQGGDFDTEILIRNPEGEEQTLTLTPYSNNGNTLSPIEMLLGPGSTTNFLQDLYFPADAASFSAEGCESCVFSLGYRAAMLEEASTAHVHQTSRFATEFTLYPGDWTQLFDGAAIVNAGDAAARIEAVRLDGNGNVMGDPVVISESLEPGGKALTIFNNIFPPNPGQLVRLSSDQEMAVMVLRISNDGRFLYENLPLPEPPAEGAARWLAHITSETGGFDTDILLHNTADSTKLVTLTPYTLEGEALPSVDLNIPAGRARNFPKLELFSGDTSHAEITGAPELLVSVGYRARLPNASTAQVHETTPLEGPFSVYPGEWTVLFDGVALVNTGDAPARIIARQRDENGGVLDEVVLAEALPAKAKLLTVLEGLLVEQPGATIEVSADQPLAVLSLRLSKDLHYLYNNPTIPR